MFLTNTKEKTINQNYGNTLLFLLKYRLARGNKNSKYFSPHLEKKTKKKIFIIFRKEGFYKKWKNLRLYILAIRGLIVAQFSIVDYYLAILSVRDAEPVFICFVSKPTARSAIVVSSVSPDR